MEAAPQHAHLAQRAGNAQDGAAVLLECRQGHAQTVTAVEHLPASLQKHRVALAVLLLQTALMLTYAQQTAVSLDPASLQKRLAQILPSIVNRQKSG